MELHSIQIFDNRAGGILLKTKSEAATTTPQLQTERKESIQFDGNGYPADKRRKGPGAATDDRAPGGAPFQP